MKIINQITLDLESQIITPLVHAKQGDEKTRFVQIILQKGGKDYLRPDGVTAVFRCKKQDGCSCVYPVEFHEDGTIMVELTFQALAVPGRVDADIVLMGADGEVLSTACFLIQVDAAPLGNTVSSSNEFVMLSEIIDEGRELLDELKRSIDTGIPSNAPSDWNAAEGETGHVRNRTHWAENGAAIPFLPETVIEIPVDEETGEPLGWNYEIGALPFVAGKTYIIVWNGVSYESVCRQVEVDGMDVFHVGNPAVLEMEDDGCPVALMSAPAMTATLLGTVDENEDPAGSVLAIYEKQDIVHRLDDRFIDAQWLAKKAVEETELVSLDTMINQIDYIPYEQLKQYDKVRVVFDGVSYECTVYHRDSGSYFGNLRMGLDADEFPHTGEPFLGIVALDESLNGLVPLDENYDHPVAIYGIKETIEKMPEAFLPEGYSKGELVEAVIAALTNAEEVSF